MRNRMILMVPLTAALIACSSTPTGTTAGSSPQTFTAASSATPASGTKATTLVVDELINASTYTAKGAPGRPGGPTGEPADGDVWAFSSVLESNGAPSGTDHVTISFGPAGTAVVDAVETLPAGRIVGHGTAPFQPTLAVPVVAGTGAYAGATGTVTIVSKDNTHNNLTISLK